MQNTESNKFRVVSLGDFTEYTTVITSKEPVDKRNFTGKFYCTNHVCNAREISIHLKMFTKKFRTKDFSCPSCKSNKLNFLYFVNEKILLKNGTEL